MISQSVFIKEERIKTKKTSLVSFQKIILFISSSGSGAKAMESNDDGLFNRFLISVGFKRKPNRDCPPPDDKLPKLVHLFYYTHQLHKQQQEYTYNPEGI